MPGMSGDICKAICSHYLALPSWLEPPWPICGEGEMLLWSTEDEAAALLVQPSLLGPLAARSWFVTYTLQQGDENV